MQAAKILIVHSYTDNESAKGGEGENTSVHEVQEFSRCVQTSLTSGDITIENDVVYSLAIAPPSAYESDPWEQWASPATDIITATDSADLILVLLKSTFFDSDIRRDVLQRALKRHKDGRCQLIPIILEPFDDHSALEGVQPLPGNGCAISEWTRRDEAFSNVAEGVRDEISKLIEGTGPVTIFCSYSHRDENLCSELATHLATLRRAGLIQEFYDHMIRPGDEWDRTIGAYLDRAQIILLLISADFLASEYCYEVETKAAIEKHKAGRARVIPILLRPVHWQSTVLSQFQALPTDARPVTEWPNRDLAFVSVCEGILSVVLSWKCQGQKVIKAPRLAVAGPLRKKLRTRRRILDAALCQTVEVGKATVLAAMIRRQDSLGLRGIVAIETRYGVTPDDVQSTRTFSLKFPVDPAGVLVPLDLTITVESPDFEPKSQTKSISVPPRGDSEPRIFLLTPLREGNLVVNLDLREGSSSVAGSLLSTMAVEFAPEIKTQALVSIPLVVSREETEESSDSASQEGEFTRFFRGPFDGQGSAESRDPGPGDFTRLFGRSPRPELEGATRVFSPTEREPLSSHSTLPADPDEYTRIISSGLKGPSPPEEPSPAAGISPPVLAPPAPSSAQFPRVPAVPPAQVQPLTTAPTKAAGPPWTMILILNGLFILGVLLVL